MPLLLALTLLLGAQEPTDAALVYFNARMALREGRPREAVQLWLLRNTIESEHGVVSAYDEDFRSVTWAALGQLGLCPDGFPRDTAGLWPLALHNWVVRNMRSPPMGGGPSPYAAFAVGRQQRHVSLRDVLDASELKAVHFERSGCLVRFPLLIDAGEMPYARLDDQAVAARVLRQLLRRADRTLTRDRSVGRGVIQARIFDLNLRLAGLAARAQRRAEREARREGRRSGLSAPELAEQRASSPGVQIRADSEEGRILRESLSWPAEEWMALSSERRQFLFGHAAHLAEDTTATRPLALAITDRLIESQQGRELQSWIAHVSASGEAEARRLVWHGERGRRLLSLDRETGFRERSVIAVHRGVDALSGGQLPEAIRAFAHALRWAEDSRDGAEVRGLARRWLSFVAAQFRVTDALFRMLHTVLPRADYAAVLEDQLWHAALGADRDSFERCVRHAVGRGALSYRIAVLTPLAHGDAGAFTTDIGQRLAASPHGTQRFLRRFVQRLQAEDAEVRSRHVPTVTRLKRLLEDELARSEGRRRRQRAVETLLTELRAIAEGATGVVAELHDGDRAHALSADREVFAGSLRVAPSDALPWPFAVAEVTPPAVFTPISLRPEEWRAPSGALIFGWRVGE